MKGVYVILIDRDTSYDYWGAAREKGFNEILNYRIYSTEEKAKEELEKEYPGGTYVEPKVIDSELTYNIPEKYWHDFFEYYDSKLVEEEDKPFVRATIAFCKLVD